MYVLYTDKPNSAIGHNNGPILLNRMSQTPEHTHLKNTEILLNQVLNIISTRLRVVHYLSVEDFAKGM
jgi:hypothetical protein